MKFRVYDEEFTSEENKHAHYTKHVTTNNEFNNMTEEQYEQEAEKLARTPVDNKNIFGYIQKRDDLISYVKYNKDNEFFTVYTYKRNNTTPYTITFFRKSWRQYNGDKAFDYFDEIPQGK